MFYDIKLNTKVLPNKLFTWPIAELNLLTMLDGEYITH